MNHILTSELARVGISVLPEQERYGKYCYICKTPYVGYKIKENVAKINPNLNNDEYIYFCEKCTKKYLLACYYVKGDQYFES